MARESNLKGGLNSRGNNPPNSDFQENNSSRNTNSFANLTEEQAVAVKAIEDEIKLYDSELSKITNRQDKIIDILDNFDSVWDSRIPVDELPDPLSDTLTNDIIIDSADIISELGFEETGGSVGSYGDNNKKSRAAQITIRAMGTNYAKEIREQANAYNEDLNSREMYISIFRSEIYKVEPNSGNAAGSSSNQIANAREKIIDILNNIY